MKKLIAIFSTAVLLGTVSCNVLDTPSTSSFDTESIYSTYALAERAIYGISEVFVENNSYYNRFVCYYGFNTDIEWYNNPSSKDADRIGPYDVLPTNTVLNTMSNNVYKNVYTFLYDGIERANLAIEGLNEYGDVNNNADMRYLLAEAMTLRAFMYYELTKAWGDVPARFHSVTPETIYLPKVTRNIIYNQILSDLDESIPHLPYPSAQPRTDRINKVFAEGLYARIALAASGYALRPGPADAADDAPYVNTGAAGTIRLSSDPNLAKSVLYPKALAHLEDAIQHGGCRLDPDMEAYWKRQSKKQNIVFDGETLYVIPFGDQRGRWNYTHAVRSDGSSYSGGSEYGGQVGPVPNFFFQFAPGDLRRDLTCVNWKFNKNDTPVDAGIGKWYFGKYRFDWMDGYDGGLSDGVKPVVMRYSDILLMAAEIENELNGAGAAKDYFVEVRKRAFGGDETAALAGLDLSSKQAMFDAIVNERAYEFCGEFLRKGDLIRWNLLKSKMDEAKADLIKLRNLEAPYDYMYINTQQEDGTFAPNREGNVYTRVAPDGKSLIFYGFLPGENEAQDEHYWTIHKGYLKKVADASGSPDGLSDQRINYMYTNNPDEYMYWPILSGTLSDSQGYVVNDYGYATN